MTDGTKISYRDERTVPTMARVPVSLRAAAQAALPGIPMASIVRVALARLAGIDADQFMGALPHGRKQDPDKAA